MKKMSGLEGYVPIQTPSHELFNFRKLLMTIKTICVLLLITCFQLRAETFSQTISLSTKSMRLSNVFSHIEKATGYVVLYNLKDLQKSKSVDIAAKDMPLVQFMDVLLKDQPYKYKIEDKTILVSTKREAKPNATKREESIQQNIVGGRVQDEKGAPLAGVTVSEKGSTLKTSTNAEGSFQLTVTSAVPTLRFSIVGYESLETIVRPGESKVITLAEEINDLAEVVVVGFGTQRKKDLTGSVVQVGGDQINNRPVANFGQAMQGLLPGLNVNFSNGAPNKGASFNVRGTTSLRMNPNNSGKFEATSDAPYVLVDGVPGDIDQINSEDIESVTVLRDASAAAIYGARAAYGVILITTKSGKSGRTVASYNGSFQWSAPAAVPNLLDAYTILDADIKAKEIIGRTAPTQSELLRRDKVREYMDDPLNQLPYYIDPYTNLPVWRANVNPFKEALANSAPMQKHNLSLAGGSDNTTYYFALGYQNQDGMYKINTDNLKRYNLALNVSSKVNNWLRMDMRTAFNNQNYWEPHSPEGKSGWWAQLGQDPGRNVFAPMKVPNIPPPGATYASMGGMYTDNILAFMDYGASDQQSISNLVFTFSPKVTLMPGWTVQSDLSYKRYDDASKDIVPLLKRVDNWAFTTVHTDPSYVERVIAKSNQYTINLFTNYNKSFTGGHNLAAVLGYNQEWFTFMSTTANGKNINPGVPGLGTSAGEQRASDAEAHWAVRGLFYRLSYDYKNKYYLQSNGRYDGTSRFRSDRRFQLFPSFSAGWVVSEENFSSFMKPYVNFLKFTGSYGKLGNQNTDMTTARNYYPYLPTYGFTPQLSFIMNGMRPAGVSYAGIVDPALTWESLATLNLGVDLTVFNNWTIDFDWYRRTTSNILTPGDDLPASLGTDVPLTNNGEMVNKGFEVQVKYNNETSGGFKYDFSLNFSDSKSKITKFNGNKINNLDLMYNGMTIGEIWGYETYGIFQSKEEIASAPKQTILGSVWDPGDVRYVDLSGNGEISPGNNTLDNHGDKRIIGNNSPRYMFGFNTNLSYKNFDFNIFLQGVAKRDVFINHNYFWGAGAIGTWETYNDSWTPERPDAYFPLYYSAGKNRHVQTRYLQNGAYLRIKNISLGYNVPRAVVDKVKLKGIRVNASAFNLFEFKSTPKAFDPELLGLNYPVMRSYALGVQVSF